MAMRLGNLLDGHHGIRIGNLTGGGHQQVLINGEVLLHDASTASGFNVAAQWFLGDLSSGELNWDLVNQTLQFVPGGFTAWIAVGDYTGAGNQQVLYFDGTNWWLGNMAGGLLGDMAAWKQVSQTPKFEVYPPQRSIWNGDFLGAGHQQVLFYYSFDGNWYLGNMANGTLDWGVKPVGNSAQYGSLLGPDTGIWMGDFTGGGHEQVLFYLNSKGKWFFGEMANGTLNWGAEPIGNSAQYGNLVDSNHLILIGDFTGAGHQQVLFYSSGDGRDCNWFLGDVANGTINWNFVGNSREYGNLLDNDHFIWIGDFTGAGHQQVLFYCTDGNWFLGDMTNGTLNWGGKPIGNSAQYRNLLDSNHAIWVGDFTGAGHEQVLFYCTDGNWFLGDTAGEGIGWHQVGDIEQSVGGTGR